MATFVTVLGVLTWLGSAAALPTAPWSTPSVGAAASLLVLAFPAACLALTWAACGIISTVDSPWSSYLAVDSLAGSATFGVVLWLGITAIDPDLAGFNPWRPDRNAVAGICLLSLSHLMSFVASRVVAGLAASAFPALPALPDPDEV